MLVITAEQIREQLGAYLTKPLAVTSGTLSTQQVVPATAISAGGLTGQLLINQNGKIVVFDGFNNRVKVGDIK